MERKTILKDEKFLRQTSKEVDLSDKSYINSIMSLKEYCSKNEVFAMASVQLGILKRIIYIKSTNLNALPSSSVDESIIIINPVVLYKEGLTESYEACESCRGERGLLTALIKRPYKVGIKFYDINGELQKKELYGMAATIFCHENDHLDGILHIDLNNEFEDLNLEERLELRKSKPYKVIEETGNYNFYR